MLAKSPLACDVFHVGQVAVDGATADGATADGATVGGATAVGPPLDVCERGCQKLPMTENSHPSGAPWRNFYGRRAGHTLRGSQQGYIEQDLAKLSPGPVEWDENPDRALLNLQQRFGARDIWLEVGFGGGEHMVHQAVANPDVALIGCEPFINGVAMLLGKIRRAGAVNIAVHPGDARDLFDVLPVASIARAFLLYPDPWPKARHHRRRFVTPEHLIPLAQVMKPGAILRIATDIPDYVRQALEQVPRCGFEWLAERPDDWRKPWGDWISTRYELKALREGRVPHYLTFRRTDEDVIDRKGPPAG
ncbi:MAG: tRNA (guanine-N7-)-methyltransferase [Paracoccaceae bacterium]|jgi:tRNA (guanine-N7-)-methyltransferase